MHRDKNSTPGVQTERGEREKEKGVGAGKIDRWEIRRRRTC